MNRDSENRGRGAPGTSRALRNRSPGRRRAARCPACGSGRVRPAFHYESFPVFLFPMPREAAAGVRRIDLPVSVCAACSHLFQPRISGPTLELIYRDYYRYYPFDKSEAMLAPYRQPFNALFDLVTASAAGANCGTLLEIGCSEAGHLAPFVEKGYSCIGVDPSPLAAGNRAFDRVRMISGFYERVALGDRVDVIVSRFNLEHIVDLSKVVRKMSRDLADGGTVFVQVPNVAYYFEHGQPLFVAHEHVHYFRLSSLCGLFERHGFSLVSFLEHRQPSIIACFRKHGPRLSIGSGDAVGAIRKFQANVDAKLRKLSAWTRDSRRIAFYGCGLSLFWLLTQAALPPEARAIVVDDNEKVHGLWLPCYGLRVEKPDAAALSAVDLIVLTLNPIYHDKVLAKLRAWGVRAKIVRIGTTDVHQQVL